MITCPSTEVLQAFADDALDVERRGEVDAHLRRCPICRDAQRALHRVEGYLRHGQERTVDPDFASALLDRALAGEFAPARPLTIEEPAPRREATSRGDHGGVARRSPLVATFVTLAAAASLVVLFTTGSTWGDAPESGEVVTHAEAPAYARLVEALRATMPDLLAEDSDTERLAGFGYDGVVGRSAELHALRSAWHRVRDPEDRVRLIRFAALIGAPGFRAHAERFATNVPTDGITPALYAIATFGGDDAARTLHRVSRRREVPPAALAEALLRTGTARGASKVWDLLMAASMARPSAYDALHRMPGREASRVLVSAYLAGDGGAALRRVIAERPDALALLRDAVSENDVEIRTRALQMLGEAGDEKAVPLLARMLDQETTRSTAISALHQVAQAGSSKAMLALADALPHVEDATDWARNPVSATLGVALRSLPEGAGGTFLMARHASARSSERRRYLIAAGLSREPDVDQPLVAALQRPQERRAALLALALTGRPSTLDAIRPYTRSHDRATRRCALAAVAALGGDEAARILSRAMRRTADRRTVMGCVRFSKARWVVPVFVDGLRYRDTREDCLIGLHRLFDGEGPESGDVTAWKAWLGLEPEES